MAIRAEISVLVRTNILEHQERIWPNSTGIGILLGSLGDCIHATDSIDVSNSLECSPEFVRKRLAQYQAVFPNIQAVGMYCFTSGKIDLTPILSILKLVVDGGILISETVINEKQVLKCFTGSDSRNIPFNYSSSKVEDFVTASVLRGNPSYQEQLQVLRKILPEIPTNPKLSNRKLTDQEVGDIRKLIENYEKEVFHIKHLHEYISEFSTILGCQATKKNEKDKSQTRRY